MAQSRNGVPLTAPSGIAAVANYHWDTGALDWVKSTGSSTAPTVAVSNFPATYPVTGTFWQATQPVSGTFWQATQPVSAASLPLPSGAATDAKLDTLIAKDFATTAKQDTAQTALDAIKTALEILDNVVSGSEAQVDIVAALPTGANVIGGVTQSGTWTVQPGNTANTTAWLTKLGPPTAVTVKSAAVTVGTSAVRCTTDGNAVSATRVLLMVQPDKNSGARFFFGPSGVTNTGATMGVEIHAGATVTLTNDAGEYYLISDTAGQTVYITEQE